MTKSAALVTAGLLASGSIVGVAAAPAANAACDDVGKAYYTVTSKAWTWKATSLTSSYVRGPGSVSLTKGRTWTVSASATGTTSAEAGVIFAKASASVSVTLGGSYSGTQSFTYTLNVPAGKTQRLQQYKRALKFTIVKKRVVAPCNFQTVWTKTITAPTASKGDQYFMYALKS